MYNPSYLCYVTPAGIVANGQLNAKAGCMVNLSPVIIRHERRTGLFSRAQPSSRNAGTSPPLALSPNKVLALEPALPPVWPARPQQNTGRSYGLQSPINPHPLDQGRVSVCITLSGWCRALGPH